MLEIVVPESFAETDTSQPVRRYSTHLQDSRVVVTHTLNDFIQAARSSKHPYVIRQPQAKPSIEQTLRSLGYTGLQDYFGYNIRTDIYNLEGTECARFMNKTFPEDVRAILTERARIFAAITDQRTISLTFGDPRITKDHIHFGPTMTGSLLHRGAEWPINAQLRGKNECGDDFFIAPHQLHSSAIIMPEEPKQNRAIWAFSLYTP
jgi:hypothetical protein